MSRPVKCPYCRNEVSSVGRAAPTACPKCRKAIQAGPPNQPNRREDEAEDTWISPWGTASFGVATLALLQASVLGLRWLTVGLAVLGLLLVAAGVRATREDRRTRDRVWFAVGGGASGLVLVVALAFPGVLNDRWLMDSAVADDPEAQVLIGRNEPSLAEGMRLSAEDWAKATTDAVRQGDVVVRVESVRVGPLPGLPDPDYLLVHLRVAICRRERTITVAGFGGDSQPVLTDDAGHSWAFREARPRRQARGEPVFDASAPQEATLGPGATGPFPLESQDYLLVFAAPPAPITALKLEVPAAAWGRKGTCRFLISGLFDNPGVVPGKFEGQP